MTQRLVKNSHFLMLEDKVAKDEKEEEKNDQMQKKKELLVTDKEIKQESNLIYVSLYR